MVDAGTMVYKQTVTGFFFLTKKELQVVTILATGYFTKYMYITN